METWEIKTRVMSVFITNFRLCYTRNAVIVPGVLYSHSHSHFTANSVKVSTYHWTHFSRYRFTKQTQNDTVNKNKRYNKPGELSCT